uniref:GATA zinc finger domain-containing protein 1 n=1 Tax=Eptatretus burgeri TaxID=7764 RepID=A0A8C4NAY1_EPTBU
MPLGLKPSCSCCRTGNTAMWRRSSQGDVVCNSCAIAPGSSGGHGNSVSKTGKPEAHRRSARLRNTKARTQPAADRKLSSKGKGRRHIFKLKNPLRAPEAVATVVTSDSILYQGVFYQVGDVVSVLDEEGELYFAQIRGFMQDQYCEKSAVITWLLPTTGSPKGKFDPSTYILGLSIGDQDGRFIVVVTNNWDHDQRTLHPCKAACTCDLELPSFHLVMEPRYPQVLSPLNKSSEKKIMIVIIDGFMTSQMTSCIIVIAMNMIDH